MKQRLLVGLHASTRNILMGCLLSSPTPFYSAIIAALPRIEYYDKDGLIMTITTPRIFIHGLEGSSQGFKATHLRQRFPGILTPDFRGSLEERMAELVPILQDATDWTIVGSSFGGLMGALFTCQHPQQVRRLILLAPALHRPAFADVAHQPVAVPTIIYHAQQDAVVPIEPVRANAARVFTNLTFHVVDDDHALRKTFETINWDELLL